MEDAVLMSEKPSTSLQLNSVASRVICRVCQKQFSQYTCPRCNTRYCSLHCYKEHYMYPGKGEERKSDKRRRRFGKRRMSHSLRCTESFMRDNVMDELQQVQPDEESKRKMLNILKRFHLEEEDDSMDEEAEPALSEKTVQKFVSGGRIDYEDLTDAEKKLFQRAVASGELGKMIEPWDPWWLKPSARTICLRPDGTHLVQPITNQETSESVQHGLESNFTCEIPPGSGAPLPSVSKLTSTEPSPFLAVHFVDIIYSYCFTLRIYNGDWQSDPSGASMLILSVSSVLVQGGQPETLLEAISNCLEKTGSPAFRHMGGLPFGFSLLDDVISLVSLGRTALICTLCDLQRLIQAAEKELTSEKQRKTKRAEIKTKLKSAERKIYFVMCWVNEQTEEIWSSLAALIKAEKASSLDYRGHEGRSLKEEERGNKQTKALIEEVQ